MKERKNSHTLKIAHTLHNWKVSFNFQLSFIIVSMSGPGGTGVWTVERRSGGWPVGGGSEEWTVDSSFLSQALSRQTETLCLGLFDYVGDDH